MRAAPIFLLLAAACAQPDLGVPGEAAAERGRPPELLPFEAILAPPDAPPEDPGSFAPELDSRAAALKARAGALRRPAAADPEGLGDRLGALRGRAEALRARQGAAATPEERERLERLDRLREGAGS